MLERSRRYYFYNRHVDMRKGFRGLGSVVVSKMGKELKSGDGFVFVNKRKNLLKILLWEGDGFSIYYKQLELGTFEHPSHMGYEISYEHLLLILQGIEREKVVKRRRYSFGKTVR